MSFCTNREFSVGCGANVWGMLWVVPVVLAMVFGPWWSWHYRGRRVSGEQLDRIEAQLARRLVEGGCESCGRGRIG
jgi:hypothetical protein